METNITRRRLVQGAGAIGVASVVGSTVVTAQEDGETEGEQGAAIRVAHASPDTPSVNVTLSPSAGAGGTDAEAGDGNETAVEGENETEVEGAGNETAGGEDGGGEEEMTIEDVGFRDVSDYTEVQAGTYQVEIVVTDGGGFLEDLFGGGDEEEVVVLDDEFEVESGTTYTIVAFGEIAQAEDPERVAELEMAGEAEEGVPGEEETPPAAADGGEDNATAAGEEANATAVGEDNNATVEGEEDNATAAGDEAAGDDVEMGAEDDTSFQVKVFEDDLSDPGEDRTRLRVIHTVPDAETLSVSTTGGDGGQAGEGENATEVGEADNETAMGDNATEVGENETAVGENETEAGEAEDTAVAGGQSIDQLAFGEADALELDAGDYTLEFRAGGAQAGEEPGETDDAGNATEVGEADNETAMGDNATEVGENETAVGENATEVGGNESAAGDETTVVGEEQVEEVEISPNGGVVYTGIALGYFDPETAGQQGGEDNETAMGDNATEVGENETAVGENETEAGENETAAGEDGEEVAEDAEGEEFEFVTVSDFEDGERADGGTGGDGLF